MSSAAPMSVELFSSKPRVALRWVSNTISLIPRAMCASPAFPETSEPGLILQPCSKEVCCGRRRGSTRSSCVSARWGLYRESDPKPAIAQLARQLNVHPEALRNWIRQDEADRGERHDRPTTEMLEENRRLRAEVKELRAARNAGYKN